MREIIAASLLVLIVFTMGCISFEEDTGSMTCIAPEKLIDGRCCFDEDSNGVCDIDEKVCPESCDDGNACTTDSCSMQTNFECKHSDIVPCCGNGVCEDEENMANECPEDCIVVSMTDFQQRFGGPDYMEGGKFVFILTGSNETDKKPDFSLNITATDRHLENIRATYNCTDSATGHIIDSINVERVELVEGYSSFGYENKFESDDYLIYTSFYNPTLKTNIRVDDLKDGETVEFRLRITKKDYNVRSDLTCEFKFYFLKPLKQIKKPLEISYIG